MSKIPARAWRRAWWIVPGVITALIIGFAVSIPIVNDSVARDVEMRLLDLPLPAGAERIDSMSQAGRIVGNGNGMQYFGALLIRSDDSADELQRFYTDHQEAIDLAIAVTPAQELRDFHGAHGFLGRVGEQGTFVVQAEGHAPGEMFENADLRGH